MRFKCVIIFFVICQKNIKVPTLENFVFRYGIIGPTFLDFQRKLFSDLSSHGNV